MGCGISDAICTQAVMLGVSVLKNWKYNKESQAVV